MRSLKYLLVPWVVISVYALTSMMYGAAGMEPYRKLLLEREKIILNLESLESRNQELEGAMDALLYDPEAIRIRARELGYGGDAERFVRIVGLSSVRNRELPAGSVKLAVKPDFVSDIQLHLAALGAGILVFGFLFLGDVLSGRWKKYVKIWMGQNTSGSVSTPLPGQRRDSVQESYPLHTGVR